MKNFDLAVIGTGPAGQAAAIQAAKLDARVCAIEKGTTIGGAALNTGTIPSKALREAALHLTGALKRGLFGDSARIKKTITIADLTSVSQQVIRSEERSIREAFDRNNVELIRGHASFMKPHKIKVETDEGSETIVAKKIIVATGTRPARPGTVPFNNNTIHCSDTLLGLQRLPRSLTVVGGGVIGTEYACIFATLGVRVTLIDGRREVLGFLDEEITEAFQYHMRRMGVSLRLGEKVVSIAEKELGEAGEKRVVALLESGKEIVSEKLLYAVGRVGNSESLQLEKGGLAPADDRGRIAVDANYQTAAGHIYAVGDIIGFPSLASTSFEQGRLAACHALGKHAESVPELFPLGIYAVPEISMVGKTEEQLTAAAIPYEAGVAQFKEVARGQLLGDDAGLLKLIVHATDRTLLGVHIIGPGATELVHIGQTVMSFGGTVDFFVRNVFNVPTLAQTYKVAALNVVNKLRMNGL